MALFMKLPFAESGAKQGKHAGWVKLDLFQFDVDRAIAMEKGGMAIRDKGVPRFSEVTISKELDATSTALLRNLVSTEGGQEIEIHLVKGSEKSSEATLKYKLKDAVFTHYSVSCSGDVPYETLRIAYSGLEMKFYAYDESERNVSSDNFVHELFTN
jgi:type VI secretion system secreted protein Hcp